VADHPVAVREHTGRLARRGHIYQAEYNRVRGLLTTTDTQGTSNLLALLEQMRPADMANALQDLPDARRNEVAAALSDRTLADVLEELPEHDQVEIVAKLGRERAADVLERMDPDDAADLLAELPKAEQSVLLDLMEPDEAAPVRQLMDYRPGTAGSVMTSEPVLLTPDATVAEALARIREPELSPVVAAQVFVARAPSSTPSGKYLGMVHFQRLLREPPSSILGGIVDNDIDPLHPDTDLTQIFTRRMATYDLVAMPVVDSARRLVGAVTVDDVARPLAAAGLARPRHPGGRGPGRADRRRDGPRRRDAGQRGPTRPRGGCPTDDQSGTPPRAAEPAWTSPGSRGACSSHGSTPRRSAGGPRASRGTMGTAKFIVYMTIVIGAWFAWNTLAPNGCASTRTPSRS